MGEGVREFSAVREFVVGPSETSSEAERRSACGGRKHLLISRLTGFDPNRNSQLASVCSQSIVQSAEGSPASRHEGGWSFARPRARLFELIGKSQQRRL